MLNDFVACHASGLATPQRIYRRLRDLPIFFGVTPRFLGEASAEQRTRHRPQRVSKHNKIVHIYAAGALLDLAET